MIETREALLQAGVRLFGNLAGDLLKGLTSGEVAREAGFHRQTFYRYWPTQAEYVQDLVRWLLTVEGTPTADGAEVLSRRSMPGDVHGFAFELARLDFATLRDDERARMRVGLLMMEVLRDEPVADLTQQYYDETMDRLAAAYGDLLEHWRLELIPGLTTRDLARMLQGLLLGLVVQTKAAHDEPHGAQLFEWAACALITDLTRPQAGP